MLQWIRIKNFTLVEEADIEFGSGFNVITGETGAGKSVILGTVSLLLGERADKNTIRSGAARCEISAGITIRDDIENELTSILEEAGINYSADEEIQLKRIISPTSTRNFINDTPCSLQTLKEIGDILIDVHGANEHQSLMKQQVQLKLLDRYAHSDKELEECRTIWEKIKLNATELEELDSGLPSKVEAEHLRMIVAEIEKTAPQPDEDNELSGRHSLAANSKQVLEITSKSAYMLTDGEECLCDRLTEVYRNLQELEKIDSRKGENLLSQCDQIMEQLRELSRDVEDFGSGVELDEKEFLQIEERLSSIQRLKRRYGPSLEQVFEALENSRDRLEQYSNSEQIRENLLSKGKKLKEELWTSSLKLSKKRVNAAKKLSSEISRELNKLGFLKSEFNVDFSEVEPGPNGKDRINFMFTPNPGEKPSPLKDIASSGEISRTMLAIKRVLAEADDIPILVFDEIDANIGGKTAATVGEELARLGATRQVLCISHLPQVASQAENHFLVEKAVHKGRTLTSIKPLNKDERARELTRMLGDTKAAETHAKELLKASSLS